jgi:hypothetical protein
MLKALTILSSQPTAGFKVKPNWQSFFAVGSTQTPKNLFARKMPM